MNIVLVCKAISHSGIHLSKANKLKCLFVMRLGSLWFRRAIAIVIVVCDRSPIVNIVIGWNHPDDDHRRPVY